MRGTVIYAREPLAPRAQPTVFLAGPTPRDHATASWRPGMIEAIHREHPDITIYSPESRDGRRAQSYDDQVGWEHRALTASTCILFYLWRDLTALPGFTTNVEFGLWVTSKKVVVVDPDECTKPEKMTRNRYLLWHARRCGAPVVHAKADATHQVSRLIAQSS